MSTDIWMHEPRVTDKETVADTETEKAILIRYTHRKLQKFLSNFVVTVANFMTRHCRNLLNFSDKFLLSDMCYTVVFFLIYMVILYINMYNRCMQTSPAVNVRAINVKKL